MSATTDNPPNLDEPEVDPRRPKRGLDRLDQLIRDAEIVIGALQWLEGVGRKIRLLARRVDEVAGADPDAAIAAVHLVHDHRQSIAHTVHTGILCALTGRRLAIEPERRHTLIAAALSCNAANEKLENELHQQIKNPTPSQLMEMRKHPEASAELLRRTGVVDQEWLEIVIQHHERPDGTGYPHGLDRQHIRPEALMVGLADRYAAFVSPHPHRAARTARKGLQGVFKDPAYARVERLVSAFIKELTIFPPGSFVRLSSNEEAIVVRRGDDTLSPYVAVIPTDPDAPWEAPFHADESQIEDSLPVRRLPVRVRQLWAPIDVR